MRLAKRQRSQTRHKHETDKERYGRVHFCHWPRLSALTGQSAAEDVALDETVVVELARCGHRQLARDSDRGARRTQSLSITARCD